MKRLVKILCSIVALSYVATAMPAAEIWIATRSDGKDGSGMLTDPYDASGAEKMDVLMESFRTKYGENLVMHFGPGVYEGAHGWAIEHNWKVRGSGMDVTVFKTRADPGKTATVGFFARCPPQHKWVGGFEISDCTFDFNVPNLRKANRCFVFPASLNSSEGLLYYVFASDNLPPWKKDADYHRGSLVAYNGSEFISTAASRGVPPAQGFQWSILRELRPENPLAWNKNNSYRPADVVQFEKQLFLCAQVCDRSTPPSAKESGPWLKVDPEFPDPSIYTTAADVWSGYGNGRNRASRVRMINGFGSGFFDREAFLVKIGGDDNLIEDCVVEQFLGDYATTLVVFGGHNNVIRGCAVRGSPVQKGFAYGGWENLDTVFENNFACGVRCVTNIDSLKSRNVIWRNNVFMNCLEVGLHINVSGGSSMDGLFICGNTIEMADNARGSAIQLGSENLSNVRIWDNVLRTVSGKSPVCAMTIGAGVRNLTVFNNSCDPEMFGRVPPHALAFGNYDFNGRPMQGVRQHVLRDTSDESILKLQPARRPAPPVSPCPELVAELGAEGEIMAWLVLAPFPHCPEKKGDISLGAGYAFDFLSEIGGEGGVKPASGQSVEVQFPEGPVAQGIWKPEQLPKRRIEWTRVHAGNQGAVDALTFPEVMKSPDQICLYAFCVIRSEAPQDVELRWGSDDGFVLFVAGKKVAEVLNDRRGMVRDSDRRAIHLGEGDTPVLMKVCNCWGGFAWQMRIVKPDGTPAQKIKVLVP